MKLKLLLFSVDIPVSCPAMALVSTIPHILMLFRSSAGVRCSQRGTINGTGSSPANQLLLYAELPTPAGVLLYRAMPPDKHVTAKVLMLTPRDFDTRLKSARGRVKEDQWRAPVHSLLQALMLLIGSAGSRGHHMVYIRAV
jgi:hypothetical protein